jgi:hypothetical protein
MFGLSLSYIIASLLFGIVGFWMLKEARRKANWELFFLAIALMVYPYFVTQALMTWAVGIALCALAYQRWS